MVSEKYCKYRNNNKISDWSEVLILSSVCRKLCTLRARWVIQDETLKILCLHQDKEDDAPFHFTDQSN